MSALDKKKGALIPELVEQQFCSVLDLYCAPLWNQLPECWQELRTSPLNVRPTVLQGNDQHGRNRQ